MAVNKKHQKQIDAAKNKIARLRQLLAAAKNQPDDPQEAPRLEHEIAALNAEIEKLRHESA
jgi:predicted  nucleic acid-binding Zn-ribbon protein